MPKSIHRARNHAEGAERGTMTDFAAFWSFNINASDQDYIEIELSAFTEDEKLIASHRMRLPLGVAALLHDELQSALSEHIDGEAEA